jgi:hypothetical protein
LTSYLCITASQTGASELVRKTQPLLVKTATKAALEARFTPTLLSGIITYNFILQ